MEKEMKKILQELQEEEIKLSVYLEKVMEEDAELLRRLAQ